jgi:hypothetical protein
MGYRGQSGSRRGSGEKFQKSSHEKAKPKPQKKSGIKYAEEEPVPSAQEIAEETLSSLSRLGTQTFAVSPFSQYYDDWLVNLRQVISEFESVPVLKVDEEFVKDRTQVFANVEGELAQNRLREAELEASAKALRESNHLLVETDAAYASQTRELSEKKNSEIEKLTKNVNAVEEEIVRIGQMRTSFFGFTKKAKTKKQAEATQRLNAAKNELELATQNFKVEQEKLHDEYEKKKQATIEKVQSLEKEIVGIETDTSAETRKMAAAALAKIVNALLQRKATSA